LSAPGPDPRRLLGLAEAAADEAARMLVARRSAGRPGVVATKSSPTDVVTEADRGAEAMIIERIMAERPGDAFLGEEGGQQSGPGQPGGPGVPAGGSGVPAGGSGVPGSSRDPADPEHHATVRWIIDPLDGTVNYLYGLPDFAVSIAAEVGGQIVAGVVHIPERGEVFTAVAGGGAWLRAAGRPAVLVRCNTGVRLARALVATGFGYAASRRRVQGEVAAALLPLARDIRRSGSAAVDLCSVAAGRVDAYYERGVNYWDIAAGGLIAREAGARTGGLSGRPPGPDLTIAAGPGLFEELHDQLEKLNPLRDE
jgi:myo-inositol-1(or 4)-monophosphatase